MLYKTDAEKVVLKTILENSLLQFTKYFFQVRSEVFIPNWHHLYICKVLEDVYNGKRKNVIFNIPPGSGKTILISTFFPLWCYAKNPHCRFLSVSCNDDLLGNISQSIKDVIVSKEFSDLFPLLSFKQDSNKKLDWVLEYNGRQVGEYYAVSMQGTVIGRRAGFLNSSVFSGAICIDDPAKSQDMASEAYRTKSNETIYEAVRSRKGSSNTPIILVQQRLHPMDATAHLLENASADNWGLVKIPALIDTEYLQTLPTDIRPYAEEACIADIQKFGYASYWSTKEPLDELLIIKEVDPVTFAAQYQQEPVPKGGQLIQPSWFCTYDTEPAKFTSIKIFADTAIGVKTHNDNSVFMAVGEIDNKLYILDIVKGKWEAPQLNLIAKEFCYHIMSKYKDSPFGGIYIEFKASGQGLIQHLRQETRLPVFDINPKGDKVLRANQVIPFIASGRVYIPEKTNWLIDFIKEISEFSPSMSQKHDDQVDCLVYACTYTFIEPRIAKIGRIIY